MYLCTVTIILLVIIKMEITYLNGFICEAGLNSLNDFEQVKNAVIVAKCKGFPFRGKAMDMAQNAISHILNKFPSTCGLFPVIYESYGGCNSSGDYTTEVVFQAIT